MPGLRRKSALPALALCFLVGASVGAPAVAAQAPVNDAFDNATSVGAAGGSFSGTLVGATNDGANTVGNPNQPDVWYTFTAPVGGLLRVNTCGTLSDSGLDTTLSIHVADGTPGSPDNQIQANDDFASGSDPGAPGCGGSFPLDSAIAQSLDADERVLIRVSQFQPPAQAFLFNVAFEPVFVDSDGDGVADHLDNCTEEPNPAQIDGDADGYGNLCDADFNQDCIANPIDLGIFRQVFFTTDAAADLNGDGIVNPIDLGIFRTLFFTVPGPSASPGACD